MSDTQTVHCRLCADLKSYDKLINLQTEEEKRDKLFEKLTRLNIEVPKLDSNDDLLPKTVCLTCIESLDNAFNFVLNVETAQRELNVISSQIVKEETEYQVYEDLGDSYDTDVKLEIVSNDDDQSEKEQNDNDPSATDDNILLSEIKLSWKDYNWICAYCDTVFPNVDELTTHAMEYHSCCNPYKCADCKLTKLKLDSFIIHVKVHRKHLKRSCYKCHLVYPRVRDANLHEATHLKSDFKCSGCNNTFRSQAELTKHCEAYKKDNKSRLLPVKQPTAVFTCDFCKKTYKHKGSLTKHLVTHTKRERKHICEKCGKSFFTKKNLDGHMMLHENVRPHKCEICKQGFHSRYRLRVHIGVHDGAKPYSCDKCKRCFRLEKHLTSHSIVHTDSLPFACTYCPKSFRFKSILNAHVRQHTGVKPYMCKICQKDFANWSNYNKHMKRRHSMEMAKKKHTPNGLFPINPTTGEVLMEPQTNETLEWIKKLQDGPRRPKISNKSFNIRSELLNSEVED